MRPATAAPTPSGPGPGRAGGGLPRRERVGAARGGGGCVCSDEGAVDDVGDLAELRPLVHRALVKRHHPPVVLRRMLPRAPAPSESAVRATRLRAATPRARPPADRPGPHGWGSGGGVGWGGDLPLGVGHGALAGEEARVAALRRHRHQRARPCPSQPARGPAP